MLQEFLKFLSFRDGVSMTCVKKLKNILCINCKETTLEYIFSHTEVNWESEWKEFQVLFQLDHHILPGRKMTFASDNRLLLLMCFQSWLPPFPPSSVGMHIPFFYILFSHKTNNSQPPFPHFQFEVCLCIEFISINKYERDFSF